MIESYTLKIQPVCALDNSLVVIQGADIPILSGRHINRISLWTYAQEKLKKIVFQIDQKDPQGRYVLNDNEGDKKTPGRSIKTFGAKDELVFRKSDLHQRLNHPSEILSTRSLIELQLLMDSSDTAYQKGSTSGWLYIEVDSKAGEADVDTRAVIYESAEDSISNSVYQIGFSQKHPFLVDRFQWRLKPSGWSMDITDTMKIRHSGRFFGMDFKRTQDDYDSQLLGVKEGPLRIIRRTENRVKVFWSLKSPSLLIDYIITTDGFIMDTIIDIPFKISLFFSELSTITSMDWNHSAGISGFTVQTTKDSPGLLINGFRSDKKEAFNDTIGRHFSLLSKRGAFHVSLDIPDELPILPQLYLMDALEVQDPPEYYAGQYGNIGFKTTGWENIASRLYHLKFMVCVVPEK